ncbi:hypothetical protein HTY52_21765 [Cupriavidus taiwanensis]|uniref:hypothetical protein n=1 Tax=Cupriavidus taiwanensis TaxID=164546 RepID=UPI001573817B|nr:hypothetical protein [Cupriavidus taiwanensis]NSX16719.1 hypothetical protein [Cupriavidus taiwanensis]
MMAPVDLASAISMRLHANLVRLAWAVLLLVLVQAWASVMHVHAVPGQATPVVAAAADTLDAAGAGAVDADRAPAEGETECDCLWCSPRLHLFLCIALAASLLGVIRRLRSRMPPVDVAAPPWRTRFLSPPTLRAPPALPRAAG